MSPEIKKPLVVLDIDGTLLDENYHANNPDLPSYISQLEANGIAFCINSNRSLHDLLPVAEQFNITGPLIGENGLFIYSPKTNSCTYLLEKGKLEAVAKIKDGAEKLLFEQLQKAFYPSPVHWEDIDTVDKISHDHNGKYEEGAVIVLNNKYRQFTVSAHLKRVKDGSLVSMREEVAQVAGEFQEKLGQTDTIDVSYSQLFANILVSSHFASKRQALQSLREQANGGYNQIYVIGDEKSDFMMVEGIGTFLTTNNANKDVQSLAQGVSQSSYSQGVTELLEQIVDQG